METKISCDSITAEKKSIRIPENLVDRDEYTILVGSQDKINLSVELKRGFITEDPIHATCAGTVNDIEFTKGYSSLLCMTASGMRRSAISAWLKNLDNSTLEPSILKAIRLLNEEERKSIRAIHAMQLEIDNSHTR